MPNWFKKAWNNGIPLMDDYSDPNGHRPSSSRYKKDPRSLVNANPEFGGDFRDRDHHKGTQAVDEDRTDFAKIRGHLPGENVLMDQDPPTGDGANDDRFVAQDEFNTDNDRIPKGELSDSLDKGTTGPHNMQNSNIFNRTKQKMKIRSLNTL